MHRLPFFRAALSMLAALCFTSVLTAAPLITDFSPKRGPAGTLVTISGSGFTPGSTKVFFGTLPARIASSPAATASSITVVVPNGFNFEPIRISTAGLTVESAGYFILTSTQVCPNSFNTFSDAQKKILNNYQNGSNYKENMEVAAGDVNGDSLPDFAIIMRGGNEEDSVIVYLNNTTMVQRIAAKTDHEVSCVALADLNGDGRPELIVGSYDNGNTNTGTIQIFKNKSTGTAFIPFELSFELLPGGQTRSLAAADLDQDGLADLTVVDYDSHSLSFFRNTSSGTDISFDTNPIVKLLTHWYPIIVSAAFLNNDRYPDLAINTYQGNNITVLLNAKNFTFAESSYNVGSVSTSNPYDVATGDMNADGLADIVSANYSSQDVSILLNKGDGTFSPPLNLTAGAGILRATIGDVNGDGWMDIAGYASGEVLIWQNKGGAFSGASSFTRTALVTPPNEFRTVEITDMNTDGNADLIVGCLNQLAIYYHYNTDVTTDRQGYTICKGKPLTFRMYKKVPGTQSWSFTYSLDGNKYTSPSVSASQTYYDLMVKPATSGTFSILSASDNSACVTTFQPGQADHSRSIIVTPAPVMSPATLPDGKTGIPYPDVQMTVNGNTNYAWNIDKGSLPAGLSLNNSTSQGLLSGTPTAAGTYTFNITASRIQCSDTVRYTIRIGTPPLPRLFVDDVTMEYKNTAMVMPFRSLSKGPVTYAVSPRQWMRPVEYGKRFYPHHLRRSQYGIYHYRDAGTERHFFGRYHHRHTRY